MLPCEPAAVECRGETVGASSLSEAQAAAGRGRIPAAHRTALGAELRGVGVWGAVCTLQVTINCAERGLLLLRVRDEIRMTIAAYQTLCVPFRSEHLNVAKNKKCFGATADDTVVWRVMLFSEVYGVSACCLHVLC